MSKRVCPEPGCPTLTNGGPCQQHRRESPTYLVRDKVERNRRALTVAAWIAEHGWTCPGGQRPAHPSRDLTAAHTIAVALGGDHSITFPILRALRPHLPRLSVLHIDAHPDIYESFEGDPFSHACPFARIMEAGLCDRLVQVGIRTMNPHQRKQADRFGVDVIDMTSWVAGRRPQLDGPVYVTVDLDGIDPAYAPGVSHPEPGGLSVREVVTMIQSLPHPIVGADVVEYNPVRDINGLTAYVCAKLIKEIVGAMVAPPPHST